MRFAIVGVLVHPSAKGDYVAHAIVWMRNDLRLRDNPALQAAIQHGLDPIPVYIHSPEEEGEWACGPAACEWLRHSLAALQSQLQARGSNLILRRGACADVLQGLVDQLAIKAIFWNRKFESAARDAAIKSRFRQQGLHVASFHANTLLQPHQLLNRQDKPFRVFTPFWRAAMESLSLPQLSPAPDRLPALPAAISAEDIASCLGNKPSIPWDRSFWDEWQPGEEGAWQALHRFIDEAVSQYHQQRDFPDRRGTSRLSPHLRFGEVSPARVYAQIQARSAILPCKDSEAYIRQLGWREFGYYLLYHFPFSSMRNLDRRFDSFAWEKPQPALLTAWQRGRTGVPIIDAGMRELWQTGWMHNRVRMITASYLCKHLRIHWIHGARWFWETLVDADLANNTLGWQWVAGTGVDAAPYFRVFNPLLQAERFDSKAAYIVRWLPELAPLPLQQRFAPWKDPEQLKRVAPRYPSQPIIDLDRGRQAALDAYAKISRSASS